MLELHRFTTEYIDTEDRIRIAGQGADGQAVVLWLTQRLLVRLLPPLVRWLEQHAGATHVAAVRSVQADVVQAMAQQCAAAGTEPLPPVPAASAARSGVLHSVEIAPCDDGDAVQLLLRCRPTSATAPGAAAGVTPARTGDAAHPHAESVIVPGAAAAAAAALPPDAGLVLTDLRLRQWLHILHQQCRLAEWPLHIWPNWMELAHESAAWPQGTAQVLH